MDYLRGRDGVGGPALKVWPEMRLPKGHPQYEAVGGDRVQLCGGELIRFRALTGICNDIKNPLMGSSRQPFARNVQFEVTFPDLGRNELARNRHGDRLGLLKPDPQVISRKLFTRAQAQPSRCLEGHGLPGASADADCDYKKAPFFNVLAAFWIQFMTHDWFSHLEEGAQRARDDGGRLRHRVGGMPPGRPHRPGLHRRERRPGALHVRGEGAPDARVQDLAEHRDRVVGRLADLRLRRDLAPPREARARRCRQAAPAARGPARGRGRAPGLPAAARAVRSDEPAVGRPGGDRLPRQLDHRHELLSQRVRARAQPVRRRVPRAGRGDPRRGFRAAQPAAARPGDPLPRRHRRRALRGRRGWSSRRRSPRSTRSSGRRSSSTTSRSTWA